jgi:hypothetical protein
MAAQRAETQRAAAAAASAAVAAASAAQWEGGLSGMAAYIISSVQVDERGLVDGASLRDFMLRSALSNAVLAQLWVRNRALLPPLPRACYDVIQPLPYCSELDGQER